jgi:nucleoside-diphosphate-sugar epimerase
MELEEYLSRPSESALRALERCPGDVMVLGAAGKMGPSLCRMLQRAVDELGDGRRVLAVSRFGGLAPLSLSLPGIRGSEQIVVLQRDLSLPEEVANLPVLPNVIFMAGQKFGTSASPAATWAMNASVPTLVANRFRSSRVVVFSTGNVYPLVSHAGAGSREDDPPAPVGEYAASCLARERIFAYYSERHGFDTLLLRLNYAVDLRYGVLVDLAVKVLNGSAIDLSMGYVNVIWQGDANAAAIAALALCARPPAILNVTGSRVLSVRETAGRLGDLLGKEPRFLGSERDDALLSNSSRMLELVGKPRVDELTLIQWVAAWVKSGGPLLSKPTHFEERGGAY